MDDITRLEAQADVLFDNLAGWEQSVINRIAKRIGKIGTMSAADVKALNNIAFVKQDMKEVLKELAEATGLNISQIREIYSDVIEEQHLENKPLYDYRNKTFVPFDENKELQSLVKAFSKTTAENMVNLSSIGAAHLGVLDEHGNFQPLEKFYTKALDKAVMQVSTGATDFHTAMRDTIEAMGGSGMRINYGSGVTRRLDSAVRQSLLWGAKQTSIAYSERIGEELDCDGIEIDYHSFPRPSHEFMQGKQYILGKTKTINGILFESADKALEALEDYGCLHYKTPIICGVSEPRYDPKELERLKEQDKRPFDIDGKQLTGYEAKQAMRRLETAVRDQKSIREAAKSSGDKVLSDRCTAKIKAYQKKYNQISEITGIAPQPKRMSITKGLNAVKSIDFSGNNGIMNNRGVSTRNLAMSLRKPPTTKLIDEEIESIKNDANDIGVDLNLLRFNEGGRTGFSDEEGVIFIRGDIIPDETSITARDRMSQKAVLAHEYYGHYLNHPSEYEIGDWRDEFRASYDAAIKTPNLSRQERADLMVDAYDRAREAGEFLEYDEKAKEIIYGY